MTKENWVGASVDCFKIIIDNLWDKAYKQGFEDGKAETPFTETAEAENKAYEKGQDEAWKLAARIARMSSAEMVKMFGEPYSENVFERISFDEAMEKMNKGVTA